MEERKILGLPVTDFCFYCAFIALVFFTESRHEPWADEAQAWLIARHLSFWDIFSKALHYEGTPGLWYIPLKISLLLRMPYRAVGWIGCSFACAGMYVFYRWAPFPLLLRALIPFTFYLCFQYAVVARSYVLVPLLLFSIAALFRQRPKHVMLVGLLIGLLANANAHGFVISGGLAATYAYLVWRDRAKPKDISSRLFLHFALAAGIYIIFFAVAFMQARPAPDNTYRSQTKLDLLRRSSASYRPPARLAGLPAQLPDDKGPPTETSVLAKVRRNITDFTSPISSSAVLAFLFFGVVLWQLWSRKLLVLLLPVIGLNLFFFIVFRNAWHLGLIFVLYIAILWIAWPDRGSSLQRYSRAELAVSGVLALICGLQVLWTVHAVSYDAAHDYSGGVKAADYVKAHADGGPVFGYGYYNVAVAAQFDQQIFANWPAWTYWKWQPSNLIDNGFEAIETLHPKLVVVSWTEFSNSGGEAVPAEDWTKPSIIRDSVVRRGYTPAAKFCGQMIMRDTWAEGDCYQIYRPASSSSEANIRSSITR